MNSRRDFLKKATLAGASMLAAPSLFGHSEEKLETPSESLLSESEVGKLIVPKAQGLQLTGTFLDEISHDIPHQNWGEKEWDLVFSI